MEVVPRKDQIVEQIADKIGVLPPPTSNGQSEPRRIFELVIEQLALDIDLKAFTKPQLAEQICAQVDIAWGPADESQGSRVTKKGLLKVQRAVAILLGG